jgi:hypothetical protein
MVFAQLAAHSSAEWVFFRETTVASLTTVKAPASLADRRTEWTRLAAILDDAHLELEDEFTEAARSYRKAIAAIKAATGDGARLRAVLGPRSGDMDDILEGSRADAAWVETTAADPSALLEQLEAELEWVETQARSCPAGAAGRKRPDGVAINWRQRKLYLLEFTRCHDADPLALVRADAFKQRKYLPLLEKMLQRLGARWTGRVLPFSVGIRGSVKTDVWTEHMTSFGMSPRLQEQTLQASVAAALEALETVFAARRAALVGLHAGQTH